MTKQLRRSAPLGGLLWLVSVAQTEQSGGANLTGRTDQFDVAGVDPDAEATARDVEGNRPMLPTRAGHVRSVSWVTAVPGDSRTRRPFARPRWQCLPA